MCQLLRQDGGCTAALSAVFPALGRVRSVFGSEVQLGYTISIMGLLNSSKAIRKVVGWINTTWSTDPSNASVPVNLNSYFSNKIRMSSASRRE